MQQQVCAGRGRPGSAVGRDETLRNLCPRAVRANSRTDCRRPEPGEPSRRNRRRGGRAFLSITQSFSSWTCPAEWVGSRELVTVY